ncbi:hypothetical protein GCM10010429_37420 [Micromonospora olivasterospora]
MPEPAAVSPGQGTGRSVGSAATGAHRSSGGTTGGTGTAATGAHRSSGGTTGGTGTAATGAHRSSGGTTGGTGTAATGRTAGTTSDGPAAANRSPADPVPPCPVEAPCGPAAGPLPGEDSRPGTPETAAAEGSAGWPGSSRPRRRRTVVSSSSDTARG